MCKDHRLLITIHGIRDPGRWQDMLASLIEERNNSNKNNIHYEILEFRAGFFDLFRFLSPFSRKKVTQRFQHELQLFIKQKKSEKFSRIDFAAHSFGTYILLKSIKRLNKSECVKFHTLLLASSVLQQTEKIGQLIIEEKFKRLINDCSLNDFILFVNSFLPLSSGLAGRYGFVGELEGKRLKNRFFKVGHSGYFHPIDNPSSKQAKKHQDLFKKRDTNWFLKEYWLTILYDDHVELGLEARPRYAEFWARATSFSKLVFIIPIALWVMFAVFELSAEKYKAHIYNLIRVAKKENDLHQLLSSVELRPTPPFTWIYSFKDVQNTLDELAQSALERNAFARLAFVNVNSEDVNLSPDKTWATVRAEKEISTASVSSNGSLRLGKKYKVASKENIVTSGFRSDSGAYFEIIKKLGNRFVYMQLSPGKKLEIQLRDGGILGDGRLYNSKIHPWHQTWNLSTNSLHLVSKSKHCNEQKCSSITITDLISGISNKVDLKDLVAVVNFFDKYGYKTYGDEIECDGLPCKYYSHFVLGGVPELVKVSDGKGFALNGGGDIIFVSDDFKLKFIVKSLSYRNSELEYVDSYDGAELRNVFFGLKYLPVIIPGEDFSSFFMLPDGMTQFDLDYGPRVSDNGKYFVLKNKKGEFFQAPIKDSTYIFSDLKWQPILKSKITGVNAVSPHPKVPHFEVYQQGIYISVPFGARATFEQNFRQPETTLNACSKYNDTGLISDYALCYDNKSIKIYCEYGFKGSGDAWGKLPQKEGFIDLDEVGSMMDDTSKEEYDERYHKGKNGICIYADSDYDIRNVQKLKNTDFFKVFDVFLHADAVIYRKHIPGENYEQKARRVIHNIDNGKSHLILSENWVSRLYSQIIK